MTQLKQDRARKTRQQVLEAAAAAFDERGYSASIDDVVSKSQLTKGGVYYHFENKDALVQGVLDATKPGLTGAVEPQELKLQEWIDTGMVLAYRLPRDTLLRAALRLSMEPVVQQSLRTPWPAWIQHTTRQLAVARTQKELLPGVKIEDYGRMVAQAWAGIAALSPALDRGATRDGGRADDESHANMERWTAHMYASWLPSLAISGIIPLLNTRPDRGRQVWEARQRRQSQQVTVLSVVHRLAG
ncbi:ScbR family autoregulator-binding transcription factor [Streptomyces sp. NPDC056149]|uniref:ScbR family autoregulator-binding transcription factor n=1 Tax=Streptomyces sp. NPDC056149 TaxID=3345728 RepID=UPI0035DA17DE